MPLNPSPAAAAEQVLGFEIGGYSVLQLGIAAATIGVAVWGIRKLYEKALGKKS